MSGETARADLESALAAYARQEFGQAALLLERAIAADSGIGARHGVLLAHALLLAAPWSKIDALLPRGTNALSATGWLDSLFLARPVGAEGRPVPWLACPAIEFLEARITPGFRVFEWGSGHSTLWWAERAAEVRAVEDDPTWAQDLAGRLPPHAGVTHLADGPEYANAIRRFPAAYFDLVTIDGKSRAACARVAPEFVKPDGMIVYDNSDRRGERDGIAALDAAGWLRIDFFGLAQGTLYRNCTSVFFRDPALLRRGSLPDDFRSTLGPTCAQALGE